MADVSASTLRAVRQIESGGNPNATTGSYKGLYQLSDGEFARYGGKGSIYDPAENERIAGMKLGEEAGRVSQRLGRDLQPWEQYLVHQQGEGGAYAHLTSPDRPAWQSMLSTGEGQQKGEGWARKAIWGNVPDQYKAQFGSVDNITSGQFAEMWRNRFARAEGQPGVDAINVAAGAKPSAPGALTNSFASTENPSMPALSADNTLGPGALNPASQGGGLLGLNVSDNTYDGLMGIASSLAGISNPDQAKALIAQQAANKKVAGDPGTWSVQTMPDGSSFYFNNKTARRIPIGNFAKPEKDTYTTEAEKSAAKSYQDYGDGIATAASNANGMASDVGALRQVLSNPAVYQGQGGEWVQSARKLYAGITGDAEGAKNIADGDIAKALSNKLALKLVQDTGNGKLLPGSFSDSDREFVKQMSTSLNNDPGANQRLLDIYERSIARAQQADQVRQQHLDANGGRIYQPSIRGEIGQLQKKWADEDRARSEAEAKAPSAAPAAKPAANTFKTKSGVTWSVH